MITLLRKAAGKRIHAIPRLPFLYCGKLSEPVCFAARSNIGCAISYNIPMQNATYMGVSLSSSTARANSRSSGVVILILVYAPSDM